MLSLLKQAFSVSKELSFSVTLMGLIHQSLQRADIAAAFQPGSVVPEVIFGLLPSKWKAPQGPVTESEFRLVLRLGLDFYAAVKALFKKN